MNEISYGASIVVFLGLMGGSALFAVFIQEARRHGGDLDKALFSTGLKIGALPFVLAWNLLRVCVESGGRAAPALFGPRRVRSPESAELVKRRTADPSRRPSKPILHGSWRVFSKLYEAVHMVVVGEPGSAKGQTIVNYVIRDQLENGEDDLVVVDVKGELEEIVARYRRPTDRVWVLSAHDQDPISSALGLFNDLDRAGEIAEALTRPGSAKDPYWPQKSADLIEEAAGAFSRLGKDVVSLVEVRDAVANPVALENLRDASPEVDAVCDQEKEWAYIRSGAVRALQALKMPRARRMFAASAGTPQPDFGSREHRNIVVIKPAEELADRLAPLVGAAIDVLYHMAAEAGWAGGRGCKFVIDEAASYMALERLPRYLEIGRGRKVQLMYVVQSVVQARDVLGREKADRVLASTELQAIGPTTDVETAEFFQKLSGEERVFYKGPRSSDGGRPWAEHTRTRVLGFEITSQEAGEWTIRHHASIEKVRVPERCWYYCQSHPKISRLEIEAVAHPEAYAPPVFERREEVNGET